MPTLEHLTDRGLCRNGLVLGYYRGPDGKVSRVNFDGGWHGVNGEGNAREGDEYRSIAGGIPVRIVKVHFGEVIAREDLSRVLEAIG